MGFSDVRKIGFDTETTGTDLETDRIVTAALIFRGGGIPDVTVTYLLNPGITIPTEASAIHGITNEMAQAGQNPKTALDDLADKLTAALALNLPVIAFNLGFDWTILDRDLARNGLRSMADRMNGQAPIGLVDPYLIDKHLDKYRKGERKLKTTCEQYGVTLKDWHTAEADALAAVLVTEKLFERFPQLTRMTPEGLFVAQQRWRREWAAGFQEYLRNPKKAGDKYDANAVVEGVWPLYPSPVAVA